jgi:hypothetical protein
VGAIHEIPWRVVCQRNSPDDPLSSDRASPLVPQVMYRSAATGTSDSTLIETAPTTARRRAVADTGIEDDQRGAPFGLAEHVERLLDALEVVRVAHTQGAPSICEKPGRNILGEGEARRAFDRDVMLS